MSLLDNAEKPTIEWPEIMPLENIQLPSIDTNLLPSWAGDFAQALMQETETPFELPMGMVLAISATAAARALQVKVNDSYIEPCNIWTAVVLGPGERKSSCLNAASAPLTEWEKAQNLKIKQEQQQSQSNRKTHEAKLNKLRKKAADIVDPELYNQRLSEITQLETSMPNVPSDVQLWTSDATPEKLGPLLEENNESLAWISTEGGLFDTLGGRYSNGVANLDLVLKAHAGDPEKINRGCREDIKLHYPRLTLGVCLQPSVLTKLKQTDTFKGRGLFARLLVFHPKSNLGYRQHQGTSMPSEIKQRYFEGITAMLNWSQPGEATALQNLELTTEAYQLYKDFQMQMELRMRPDQDFEYYRDWASKAPGAAIRIAGVFHAIEYAFEKPWLYKISNSTMEAAIRYMKTAALHNLKTMELLQLDPHHSKAQRVIELLKRNKTDLISIRDIFQRLKHIFKKMDQLSPVLSLLIEHGYIQIEENSTQVGRPRSATLFINPNMETYNHS